MKPTKTNKTGRSTAQDVVMTPPETAIKILNHFKPTGKILEPCRGDGAFYNAMVGDNIGVKYQKVKTLWNGIGLIRLIG